MLVEGDHNDVSYTHLLSRSTTQHTKACSPPKDRLANLVPYTRRLGARGVAGVAPERGFSTGPYTIETKFLVGRGAAERLPVQGEVSIGFDGAVCFRAGAEEKKKFWCKVSCSIDAPQAGLHIACGFAPGGGEFVRPLHSSHIRVLGPRKSSGGISGGAN